MEDEKIKGRNSWIEGCWNIQRRASEPLPGLVLGTGFEDFFDSTCVRYQTLCPLCPLVRRHVLFSDSLYMIYQSSTLR
jgi:hypothetical protein